MAVDLGRMSSVRSLDVPSSLVTVGPGMRGPALEEELSREGLTFGHLPQSWEFATLGGYAMMVTQVDAAIAFLEGRA